MCLVCVRKVCSGKGRTIEPTPEVLPVVVAVFETGVGNFPSWNLICSSFYWFGNSFDAVLWGEKNYKVVRVLKRPEMGRLADQMDNRDKELSLEVDQYRSALTV